MYGAPRGMPTEKGQERPQIGMDQLEEVALFTAAALLAVAAAGLFLYLLYRYGARSPALQRVDDYLSGLGPWWPRLKRRFSPRSWMGLLLSLAVVTTVGFGSLFLLIIDGWTDKEALYEVDLLLQRELAGLVTAQTATYLRYLTHLGDGITVTVVSVLFGLVHLARKQWYRLSVLVVTVGAGEAVLWTMKAIFGRARPGAQLAATTGASFPSGHSFAAVVLYGYLFFLLWSTTQRVGVRVLGGTVFLFIVVGVGCSRILLSVHWASDVLGGWTLGFTWLIASLVLVRAYREYAAG